MKGRGKRRVESKREMERGKKEMYKERKNKQTAGE